MTPNIDRETTVDGVVVIMMVGYGLVVWGNTPVMSVAAWMIAGLLILRHSVNRVEKFVDENQVIFLLILLAILTIGLLLS